ncbi:MAG: nicotinamide mononucleotide transporter [Deltaproteobacteria bacterium]|nr:nicotinamide mononucleotide transporter [Deltaproteobacteria bacterium]
MTPIEGVATALGLASVWLSARQSLWCWPTGLGMVTLYLVIFWEAKLYADMALQGVYIALQVYGWAVWARGGDDGGRLPVRGARPAELWGGLALATAVSLAAGAALARLTDGSLPWLDATTATFSLLAQAWMSRKIWQAWRVWILVDVLSVPMYAMKGLWLTCALYTVFLGLAWMGLRAWRKEVES